MNLVYSLRLTKIQNIFQNVGQFHPAPQVGTGGPIYTPSPGVMSMRVVNNSVMTPAVMTTGPSAVASTNNQPVQPTVQPAGNSVQINHQMQVAAVAHQMRPPPGLQAVTVQPNDSVQVQLSPSQRFRLVQKCEFQLFFSATPNLAARKFTQPPMAPIQVKQK